MTINLPKTVPAVGKTGSERYGDLRRDASNIEIKRLKTLAPENSGPKSLTSGI